MRGVPRVVGDVGLAVFGVLVALGAVAAVKDGGGPSVPPAQAASISTSSSPSASPEATGAPAPAAEAAEVVVAGRDLAALTHALASATGDDVVAVPSAAPAVLAAGALDTVTAAPRTVVLQVLAGATTTVRTATALAAVHGKWPEARVVVLGPFSSGDRKSAAAAKSAALAGRATFLDPVDLGWRTADTSAVLTAADRAVVAAKLAAALG